MKYLVYDFDHTIYAGDSTVDFYKFCVKKDRHMLKYLPKQLWYIGLYFLGIVNKKKMKEMFFSFLKDCPNPELWVEEFWVQKTAKIGTWYLGKNHEDDIVISASPAFLVKPIMKTLGVNRVIATEVDSKTGVFLTDNCHGEEKVKRLWQEYPYTEIEEMYTDSLDDLPLLERASKGFIVDHEVVIPYSEYQLPLLKKLKRMFFAPKFVMFVLVGCLNTLNGIVFSYLYSLIFTNGTIAFIAGYLTSLIFAYLLNSYITFKDYHLSFGKFIKLCISYIPNFVIQLICVSIFLNILAWPKLLTYAIAAIIGLPITFIALSLFTFGKKKQKK